MSDYRPQTLLFGLEGLDLQSAIDKISETKLARFTNCLRDQTGNVTGRPGQAILAIPTAIDTGSSEVFGPITIDEFTTDYHSGITIVDKFRYVTFGFGVASGLRIHSIKRLNDPTDGGYNRFVGIGSTIWGGTGATLALLDSGFSGNPLSFVTSRPVLTNGAYLYVADSDRLRKYDINGNAYPIGLPIPYAPLPAITLTTTLDTKQSTTIDAFDAVAGWTANAGSGAAGAIALVASPVAGNAVQFTTAPGAAPAGYYNFFNKVFGAPIDLSLVGALDASDEDQVHLWLNLDRPDRISEIRIYIIVASGTSTTILPGTDPTNNKDAYVRIFRPSDFTSFYESSQTAIAAASAANQNYEIEQGLIAVRDDRDSTAAIIAAQQDPSRAAANQLTPGRGIWTEFGIVGLPLKRGDFKRLGNTTSRGWNTTTAICISILTNTNQAVNVAFDDMILTGGSGLNSTPAGNHKYDYRCTNYDPRTGVESNGSAVQATSAFLDSIRRAIVLDPQAYLSSAPGTGPIRQRFYRRGGSLVNDWYYVGQNSADGGTFTDNLEDAEIVTAGTLSINNDQPVTSVNENGDTEYAEPVHTFWGPVQDLFFACGDRNRPGSVYWCSKGNPDAWPSTNYLEVCSPSEELIGGVVLSGQSFALSRDRMYSIIPSQIESVVSSNPTECTKGPVSRTAYCVGNGLIFICANDGIYATTGGKQESITEELLRPLFYGKTVNGYVPIDLTYPQEIRLAVHKNELWFTYRDTSGGTSCLIYSLIQQYWRAYDFSADVACAYGEEGVAEAKLLFGSFNSSGYLLEHSGTTDFDGTTKLSNVAISGTIRTGALDQSLPRNLKQYGDSYLKFLRNNYSISVVHYLDDETVTLAGVTLNTGSGIQQIAFDPFTAASTFGAPSPRTGRNISMEITWSGSTTPPVIYHGGPSFILLPELTVGRPVDWDSQGRLTDKYVKGIILDCDTAGQNKTISIEFDGAVVTTVTATASGRQSLQFAWPRALGRFLRFRPTDSNNWLYYSHQWIFDEEPAKLTRWETNELDHGQAGWQIPLYGYIGIRSTANVTLVITCYNQAGVGVDYTYVIPSTAGVKQVYFLKLDSFKGVMFKYTFTSASAFWLYREESVIFVQVWGKGAVEVKPFGTDDLDGVRGLRDAGASAERSGGGAN